MKTILFTIAIIAFFACPRVSAQTINGVKLSELKEPFLELRAFKQEFGSKVLVQLEYGQKVVNDRQASLVKDENGKNMEFNSALDFINKMTEFGYELLTAYAVTYRDDTILKFYVLKRSNLK
ncbi:hypothetical protein [Pedobacter sp.]